MPSWLGRSMAWRTGKLPWGRGDGVGGRPPRC